MNQYETHLTLVNDDELLLATVRLWAESAKLKWTQIVLDRGDTPVQPMVTFWGKGTVSEQLRRADEITQEIRRLGGSVVRVKVEANVANSDVPNVASGATPEYMCYFEHHVKLLLSSSSDLVQLSQRARDLNARLSQNVRRVRPDGQLERFVTQRIHSRDRSHAKQQLDQLLNGLNKNGFHVLEVEEEYVVFDSNLAIDSGWLERGGEN